MAARTTRHGGASIGRPLWESCRVSRISSTAGRLYWRRPVHETLRAAFGRDRRALVDECVRLELNAMEQRWLADPATKLLETGPARAPGEPRDRPGREPRGKRLTTVDPLVADLVNGMA
jgi:hypothetical protein